MQSLKVQKTLTSKEELLRHRRPESPSTVDQKTQEDPLKASKKLTKTLQQALEMMDSELSRSIETARTLDSSMKVMDKTSQEYTVFGTLMESASSIMTKLKRKQWLDWILLGVGLLIFFSTVLYIISRRF
jgi:protein transport protein SEC20